MKTTQSLGLGLSLLYLGTTLMPVLAAETPTDASYIEEAVGNNGPTTPEQPNPGSDTSDKEDDSNNGYTAPSNPDPSTITTPTLQAVQTEFKPGDKAIIILVYDPTKDDGQSPKWRVTSKKLANNENGLLQNDTFNEETVQLTEGESLKYATVTSDEPALVNVSCSYQGKEYSLDLSFKENAKPDTTSKPGKKTEVPMFRLYNPNSGEHFYTEESPETINLIASGWSYEGVGWIGCVKGDPVYRLYNPNSGDHHYTMNADEKNMLVSLGWKDEGIGWQSAASSKAVPVYRQYNPNAKTGSHNYTPSQTEHNYLVSIGWKDEGVAWKALR